MIPNYGETWSRLNPMNADTDLQRHLGRRARTGTATGTRIGCEVRPGLPGQFGNPYHYNIYNSGSKPTTCVNGGTLSVRRRRGRPPVPTNCPGSTLTVTYAPQPGAPQQCLADPDLHRRTTGSPSVTTNTMNSIGGGQWQYQFPVLGLATQINFVFRDTGGTNGWDNNGGANWNVAVRGPAPPR
jgi:hypothetical protein